MITVIEADTTQTLRVATSDDLRRALDCDRDTGAFKDVHGVTVYLDGCAFDGESYDLVAPMHGFAVGARVEGGDTPEDHDMGTVVDVEGDAITVAWDGAACQTTQGPGALRHVDTSFEAKLDRIMRECAALCLDDADDRARLESVLRREFAPKCQKV